MKLDWKPSGLGCWWAKRKGGETVRIQLVAGTVWIVHAARAQQEALFT